VDVRERRGVDESRADGIEEQLEGAEEGFSEEGVEEEGFNGCREICVEAGYTKGFVVG